MKCLKDGCVRLPRTRGLCLSCYSLLLKRIKQGEVTMDDEVKCGRALPNRQREGRAVWGKRVFQTHRINGRRD